ncbi:MAG: Bax inhibitor-1/YccA family protein [Myxococcales bacterium]|nr:Bax inhibitor-1/YccA family protein [Myxococcales bacterium]MCB9627974.1 Bax inhibitor-1 family protein [Sandaracinaceae bacterium]
MQEYSYAPSQTAVADRSTFIVKTYLHLLGAIMAFVAIEVGIFASGLALPLAQAMMGVSWLLVLGAFMMVSWLGSRVAATAESKVAQYAALGAYVLAEAIIFVPMLLIADMQAGGVITSAALVTIMGFLGLTAVVFVTRKDFSFLRGVLLWAGFGVLLLIVAGVLFGFELGTFFSVGMVVFAGAAILYDTSNVLHHYPEDRYVGAALALFASVALLFWYVLRLFMSRD